MQNSNVKKVQKDSILKMTQLAILAALVVVFQLVGGLIPMAGTSLCVVMIPITIGAIMFGPKGGAFLGFVFGIVTIGYGFGADLLTTVFMQNQPIVTITICLGKALAAGIGAGFAYNLLSKYNKLFATFVAATVAPLLNTGIFIAGSLLLITDTTYNTFFGQAEISGMTATYLIVFLCAGVKSVGELGLNVFVAPAMRTIVKAITKENK